ncbi:TetR/AcrR family transcriptional regulator [Gorillibacterium sp. sgz500922]|uniref:TetR/AcrR family transcriptional regulator n=1 Tax=Gorillibacterium sp. sgz500922 TaxID=3446694 RepID=UPI003F664308
MSPRSGLDQAAILAAASELADSQGFEALTLATLAHKLNIRPPSLYNHIAGLPELRRLLALDGLTRLTEQLTRRLEEEAAGEEAVYRYGEGYLAFARRHPGLYEAIQRAPAPDDPPLQAAAEQVVGLGLKALAPYRLSPDEAIHAVRGIRSLLHGFVLLEKQGGFGLPQHPDASFRFALAAYASGLKQLRSGAR